jgi:hypothetical protein
MRKNIMAKKPKSQKASRKLNEKEKIFYLSGKAFRNLFI